MGGGNFILQNFVLCLFSYCSKFSSCVQNGEVVVTMMVVEGKKFFSSVEVKFYWRSNTVPVVNVEETLLPAQFLLLSNSHGVARCRCPCRTFSESSINTRHDMQVCMEEK